MLTFVLGIIVGLLIGWWIWARGTAHTHDHGARTHDGAQHGESEPVAGTPVAGKQDEEEPLKPTPMMDSGDAIAPTGVPHIVDNRIDAPVDANMPVADEAPSADAPPRETADSPRFGEPRVSDVASEAEGDLDSDLEDDLEGNLEDDPPSDAPTASAGPPVDETARERARAIGISPAETGALADDLTRIKGIGPKLEIMLHDLGVYTFAQIATWSDDEIDRVDDNLTAFKGRARRDDWRDQARELRD